MELVERSAGAQLRQRTSELMKDMNFLIKVAEACNSSYYRNTGQEEQSLFDEQQKKSLLGISGQEKGIDPKTIESLAMNTAGFFAIQEAVFLISKKENVDPLVLLKEMVEDNMSEEQIDIAMRFAHATWLTGNAFRGRFERPVVKAFDDLPQDEKDKDYHQIIAAAKVWKEAIDK